MIRRPESINDLRDWLKRQKVADKYYVEISGKRTLGMNSRPLVEIGRDGLMGRKQLCYVDFFEVDPIENIMKFFIFTEEIEVDWDYANRKPEYLEEVMFWLERQGVSQNYLLRREISRDNNPMKLPNPLPNYKRLYDLIGCDVIMPIVRGNEVISILKRNEKNNASYELYVEADSFIEDNMGELVECLIKDGVQPDWTE